MIAMPVIIGANYGDEGKGLITDFEVRRLGASCVTRFNGGAQAGHTVVTDDTSHVFGHLGSGTLANASTYLSSKFIVNPLALEKELTQLGNVTPSVFVHPDAIVTTIYDMAINSLLELKRGNSRHGSCGMGINETETRSRTGQVLYAKDLSNYHRVIRELRHIREDWVPRRLAELSITDIPEPYASIFANTNFEAMANDMIVPQLIVGTPDFDSCVFEGAQGLGLDEFMGTFPYVTRSMTGLPYAIISAAEIGVYKLSPIYVTRAYMTRHGNGPFANEGGSTGCTHTDTTNVPNQWQGTLRYAPLDVDGMISRINDDISRSKVMSQLFGVEIAEPTLAITCLDQIETSVIVNKDGLAMSVTDLPRYLADACGMRVSHTSHGPKAQDVKYMM